MNTKQNEKDFKWGGTYLQHSLANIDLKQDQIYYTNWRYIYAS